MKKTLVLLTALAFTVVSVAACAGMMAAPAESEPLVEAQPGQEQNLALPTAAAQRSQNDQASLEEPAEEEAVMAAPEFDAYAADDQAAGEMLMEEPVEGEILPPDTNGPPEDMFFDDYGVNPFVLTAEDNLSTFAIDVDTGSYTLTRSYLRDGYLPPAEAIRLEEFVNYFDQAYPLPQTNAFNIIMDAAPTPYSAEGNLVMRVGVQGYDVPADQRPDATLIFVIDVSGSMSGGNRLEAVKVALNTLVEELRPTDQIGIVVYGSQGRVVLEPTPVQKKGAIVRAINRLQTEGSTNAEEGLRLAYEMASVNYDPSRINRLILCSDGVANVGATGPDSILETVRRQANDGVTLTTVGFGMGNYNDVLMEQLANDGDGQYFYVDTQAEARRVFVDDLTGTLLTIARDAKIQVEFNPATVSTYRLMGYENRDVADQDFRNDTVDAGEIGAGHSVTALYEVVPVEGAQGVLATARLRWEDPETGEVTEIEQPLAMDAAAAAFDQADPHFQLDVAVAAFADILGEGMWAQSTSLDAVARLVDDLRGKLGQEADVTELYEMIHQASHYLP